MNKNWIEQLEQSYEKIVQLDDGEPLHKLDVYERIGLDVFEKIVKGEEFLNLWPKDA